MTAYRKTKCLKSYIGQLTTRGRTGDFTIFVIRKEKKRLEVTDIVKSRFALQDKRVLAFQ